MGQREGAAGVHCSQSLHQKKYEALLVTYVVQARLTKYFIQLKPMRISRTYHAHLNLSVLNKKTQRPQVAMTMT